LSTDRQDLRSFRAVAHHDSLTAAADALRLSRPGPSR
jgi:DNA-binding transcriptional LysR family regulator